MTSFGRSELQNRTTGSLTLGDIHCTDENRYQAYHVSWFSRSSSTKMLFATTEGLAILSQSKFYLNDATITARNLLTITGCNLQYRHRYSNYPWYRQPTQNVCIIPLYTTRHQWLMWITNLGDQTAWQWPWRGQVRQCSLSSVDQSTRRQWWGHPWYVGVSDTDAGSHVWPLAWCHPTCMHTCM